MRPALCICGLSVALLGLVGCAYRLPAPMLPSQHLIRLNVEAPQHYRVRVVAREFAVDAHGQVSVTFPATRRECSVYLFDLILISRGKDPRDAKSISVLGGDRVVRALSMNEVLKLPVDDSGAHLLTIKGQ